MARQPGQAGHQLPQRDPGTRTPALADRPKKAAFAAPSSRADPVTAARTGADCLNRARRPCPARPQGTRLTPDPRAGNSEALKQTRRYIRRNINARRVTATTPRPNNPKPPLIPTPTPPHRANSGHYQTRPNVASVAIKPVSQTTSRYARRAFAIPTALQGGQPDGVPGRLPRRCQRVAVLAPPARSGR